MPPAQRFAYIERDEELFGGFVLELNIATLKGLESIDDRISVQKEYILCGL